MKMSMSVWEVLSGVMHSERGGSDIRGGSDTSGHEQDARYEGTPERELHQERPSKGRKKQG